MEKEVGFDKFAKENSDLAKQISLVFQEAAKEASKVIDTVVFKRVSSLYQEYVDMSFLTDEPKDDYPGMVDILKLSAVAIGNFDHSQGVSGRQVVTPQGVFPVEFIASDNNLYVVEEKYFFNEYGQAIKVGQIIQYDILDDDEEEKIRTGVYCYPRLNFMPSEDESVKPMVLEPGDYEKIGGILWQIKLGEFALYRVR